ncbi:MAG TPA: DUF983 domain-containing protein [Roseiflexaceae bacterium]|nr:DUF983 domain-containing protein [Roseiflexaceae bacterium]HMP43383.1 DUF983 domain-containing protein [Roseiflexaceae bacterium]
MRRICRILFQSLCLICPACQRGRMFRSWFRMNIRCPVCGIIFERDAGEVTGGVAINTLVTLTIAVCGAALAFSTKIPVLLLLAVLSVLTILFPLWFYRHARSLWVGILYLTGSIDEG